MKKIIPLIKGKKKMNFIEKILTSKIFSYLNRIQRFILFTTNIALLIILGAVIILRDGFNTDFYGYDELILLAGMWLYFIGSSYGMMQEGHVKAEILALIFPEQLNRILKVIVSFFETIISGIFTFFAFEMVSNSFKTGQITSAWNIPFAVPQTAILIGFALMTLYSCIYFIRNFCTIKEKTMSKTIKDGVQ